MKTLLYFLLLAIGLSALVSSACERPTDSFDRKNPYDPANEKYVPGSASEVYTSYNKQGTITVSWTDTANFEDGYIIEKSLSDTISFKEIARVGENETTFIDSSKIVRKDTFYRITSFMQQEDITKRFTSVTGKLKSIGKLISLETKYESTSKSLSIRWDENSPFETGFYLEVRTNGDSTYKVLKKLKANKRSFVDDLADISFGDRHYRVRMVLEDSDFEDTIDILTSTFDNSVFYPSDLDITFKSEQSIEVSWFDNSHFENGFRVYRKSQGINEEFILMGELPENTISFQDNFDLQNQYSYTYKVAGFTSNTESSEPEQTKHYTIPTPAFTHNRYGNTSSSSITLNWKISDASLVNRFIIERKRNTSEPWVEVARVDKSTRSYTDIGLNPAYAHMYRIRTISSDYSDELKLYYRILFSKIAEFDGHSRKISDLAYSPDGVYLASSSNYALGYGDTFVNIWDINSKQLFTQVNYHQEPITSVHFSNDGTMLASGSWFDGMVNVYEFPSGNLIKSFGGVNDRVDAYDVKFSPDSKFIASTGGFSDVRKWEISTGNLLFHHQGRGSPYSTPHVISFSPDGSEIAVDDKGLAILDATTGTKIQQLQTSYQSGIYPVHASYSSDGSRLVYTIGALSVYETDSWSQTFTVPRIDIYEDNRHGKYFPAFHPSNNSIVAAAKSNKINFRDIENGEILNRLSVAKRIAYFTYSPEGSQIAVGFEDGTIEVWEESNQLGWKKLIPF